MASNSRGGEQGKAYGTQLLEKAPYSEALAEVPFGELAKLKSCNDGYSRPSGTPQSIRKRKTKNHPIELSSKPPVSLFKDISVDGTQRGHRDPRFGAASAAFNQNKFRSDFAFLYDEALPSEAQDLKKRLKTAKSEERREIQQQLSHVQQQIHEEKERRQHQSAARHIKSQETKAVKSGSKPYYLKRREVKKERLIAKYKSLKAEGQLGRYIEKRTRRHRHS